MRNKALSYIFAALLSFVVGAGCAYLWKTQFAKEPVKKTANVQPTQIDPAPNEEEPKAQSFTPQAKETKPQEPAQPVAQDKVAAVEDNISAEAEKPIVLTGRLLVTQTAEGTFTVTGLRTKNAVGNLEYELKDKEKHRYTSKDGNFENVAPNADGRYMVIVTDAGTGLKSDVRSISGFILQKEVEKLNEKDVADILNTGNASKLNPFKDRFVNKTRISCNQAGINNWSDVFQAVSMDGMTASVSDLEYDVLGRIVSLTITLN